MILAIARLVEKKGLRYVIQAFHQLCTMRHDVELWLVGIGARGAASAPRRRPERQDQVPGRGR